MYNIAIFNLQWQKVKRDIDFNIFEHETYRTVIQIQSKQCCRKSEKKRKNSISIIVKWLSFQCNNFIIQKTNRINISSVPLYYKSDNLEFMVSFFNCDEKPAHTVDSRWTWVFIEKAISSFRDMVIVGFQEPDWSNESLYSNFRDPSRVCCIIEYITFAVALAVKTFIADPIPLPHIK